MKLISWNCRGLGRPLTVHNLKGICKSHSLKVGFLCEIKNQSCLVVEKLRGYGFTNFYCVNPEGRASGLVMC